MAKPLDDQSAALAFDVHTSIELARRGTWDRLGFTVAFGLIALLVLPLLAVAAWVAALLVWELAVVPRTDRIVSRLPEDRAAIAFAIQNLISASLYPVVPLLCLIEGTPAGVAMALVWFCGSVLTNFIHFNANRRLLLATMVPVIAASIVGPLLAYGLNWQALIVPAVLGLYLLAARRFSLDHGAILRQLADRQVALVDLERKLSVAIEASGDGLFECDLITGDLHVSPAWLAMLGYGPGEVEMPIDWRAFVHPDDHATVERDYAAHFQGETPYSTSELRMRCKSGEHKWVLSRGRLVARTPEGEPSRLVGTTIDISARKALEHQLEAARDLAESANDAKSVFITNMSHEIRTPLNGVIGITGALARTELSPEQREMVALVQSSGQMLDRLLSDILDQAKIEAGNFQLQIAPFDLRREIEAAAELMRARADEKGLGFQTVYGESAQGMFEGDAVRIRQVVSNLASNAIKFTAAGAVTIKVQAFAPRRRGKPTVVRIDVTDSGIGFDAEVASRLFSRFVQADGSISRQFGGSGLGLAICKALTELMQGQITARSQPGVGSTFTVEIPLARSVADHGRRRCAAAADEGGPALSRRTTRPRILLAEDHPTNQRVVQLILEPTGIDLTVVSNGQEAVDVSLVEQFDLILMDMQMPLMDGLAATRAIRRRERETGRPPTPIAMFTANAMDEHLAQAIAAGANHHISKPITPERLLAGIELALGGDDEAALPAPGSAADREIAGG